MEISRWKSVILQALHSLRSLLGTASNKTPHKHFLNFPRWSSFGLSVPTWLTEESDTVFSNTTSGTSMTLSGWSQAGQNKSQLCWCQTPQWPWINWVYPYLAPTGVEHWDQETSNHLVPTGSEEPLGHWSPPVVKICQVIRPVILYRARLGRLL